MYKVHVQDNHFVMRERGFGGSKSSMSLVAMYNKLIPNLSSVFNDALVEFNKKKIKGLKREEYRKLRYATVYNAVEESIANDYDIERLQAQGYDFALYVEMAIHLHWLSLHNRVKRFKRKADLNPFNYYVTATYDDNKHDEESFRKSLKKCFNNLHTRRGWLVAGKFERSPVEKRLHFHCFIYIPNGEMVGTLYEDISYSTKKHNMQTCILNTFFCEQFGRTDFVDISNHDVYISTIRNYITKYIYKEDGEKMFYSRGIPTYIESDLPLDEYVFCAANEFARTFFLSDNCFYCDKATNRYLMYDLDLVHTHNRIHMRV